MKKLLLILLIPTVCFSARKLTFGGELLNANGQPPVYFIDNHPEELGFLSSGANGYGGTISVSADRTGHGTSALDFTAHLMCGIPDIVHTRTFLGIGIDSIQTPIYLSFWIKGNSIYGAPQTSGMIMFISGDATHNIQLYWSSSNKIGLAINGGTPNYSVTSHSTDATWFHIKVYSTWDTLNGGTRTVLYDGADSVVSTTAISHTAPTGMQFGTLTEMDDIFHSTVISFDDMFFNDSRGTRENGFADDSSYVVYLPAVSDTARGNWVNGDRSTTNLWNSVDNVPPRGSTAEGTTTSIFDTVSSATDNYDAAVKSLAEFGIPSNHYVRMAQAIARTGEHDSAGSASGAISIVSNPGDTTETTFLFGANQGAHQLDYYPSVDYCGGFPSTDSKYVSYRGRPVYITNQNMISRSDRPIVRVGKRTASTKKVCVDQLGLLLEVSPNAMAGSVTQTIYQDDD